MSLIIVLVNLLFSVLTIGTITFDCLNRRLSTRDVLIAFFYGMYVSPVGPGVKAWIRSKRTGSESFNGLMPQKQPTPSTASVAETPVTVNIR